MRVVGYCSLTAAERGDFLSPKGADRCGPTRGDICGVWWCGSIDGDEGIVKTGFDSHKAKAKQKKAQNASGTLVSASCVSEHRRAERGRRR